VPWCEGCARFYNPSTLRADGTCPACGRQVAEPRQADGEGGGGGGGTAAHERAPWHFWVLLAAVVAYLAWRVVQLVVWAVT
jgi:hypothetical protein